MKFQIVFVLMFVLMIGCQTTQPSFKSTDTSVRPGSSVKIGGKPARLSKGSLQVGDDFVKIAQNHGFTMPRQVSIVNIVPSIDTPVCEGQSHILGESPDIHSSIARVSISRDLPMAQQRFAKEARLTNIKYFSDFKGGAFGKQTGLMINEHGLLARAVIVTDKSGIVRHIQVVPDVGLLPDMNKAIKLANSLR